MQITVTATIAAIGNHTFSVGKPRKADFINIIPCAIGKIPTIFCITVGITSNGSVAPEKNIGK